MSEKRKQYDREFREGAVRIVEVSGKPIAQVARDPYLARQIYHAVMADHRARQAATQKVASTKS